MSISTAPAAAYRRRIDEDRPPVPCGFSVSRFESRATGAVRRDREDFPSEGAPWTFKAAGPRARSPGFEAYRS